MPAGFLMLMMGNGRLIVRPMIRGGTMKKMKTRVIAGLGAALVAVGLSVAVPVAAEAGTKSNSCSGTHVATKTVQNNNGTVVGRAGIYRNGDYMCAVLIKAGPVYGVATWTQLHIESSRDIESDAGYFQYKTDALTVYAPSHSVRVTMGVTGKNGVNNWGSWTVNG